MKPPDFRRRSASQYRAGQRGMATAWAAVAHIPDDLSSVDVIRFNGSSISLPEFYRWGNCSKLTKNKVARDYFEALSS
jgi:hypothetical protein